MNNESKYNIIGNVNSKDGTITVNGYIFDTGGNPVYGVAVSLLYENQVTQSSQMNENSNSFQVWTYRPDEIMVKFDKSGYEPLLISFNDIINNNNIVLQKSKTSVGMAPVLLGAGLLLLMTSSKKKGKVGRLQAKDIQPWLLLAGGIGGFFLVRSLLAKFGLVKGSGQIAVDSELKNPNSPWKPAYWKNAPSYALILDYDTAVGMAHTIFDSFGITSDDYNQVLGVFNRLRTKSEVSYLADIFSQQTFSSWFGISKTSNLDLLTFLTDGGGVLPWDGLSDTHLKTITDLVDRLPNYTA